MKFVLFVEGQTETKALPSFLKRWLDPQLSKPVGVDPVRFDGWSHYEMDIAKKVALIMGGTAATDVIACIGLLDLYGPTFYPPAVTAASQRYVWAKKYIEKQVGNKSFRQHFAVHELEAWLLADPKMFPREVMNAFPKKCANPESVNFVEPPSKLLDRLYENKLKRGYKKVTYGADLFQRLTPDTAYSLCPKLKELLDDMLMLAKQAGL